MQMDFLQDNMVSFSAMQRFCWINLRAGASIMLQLCKRKPLGLGDLNTLREAKLFPNKLLLLAIILRWRLEVVGEQENEGRHLPQSDSPHLPTILRIQGMLLEMVGELLSEF